MARKTMAKSGGSGAKWVILVLLLAAIAGGLVWYSKSDNDEAPQFQTTTATRGDIVQLVSASGTLNPVINVQVGSQISGNIQRLFVDYNSLVKSNQVVAQLDPAIFQATVHQAEGDLANTRAALELAQINARRSTELLKNNLIPSSDNDKAVADLHQAEAMVKIKEASLERSRVDLAHCTIYAPVDGIVISRSVDVGQTVAASMSAPTLFVIANDLSKMQIDANVSEADVGTVEEGQNVSFTVDAFVGRTFNGKVIQIRNAPITVQNVVTYDTVIEVNNADLKLKPGMTATVSITTAKKTGVLKVANAALRFKPPEPHTNQTFALRFFAWFGRNKAGPSTNTVAAASGTNKMAGAESTTPALSGNEPPEELMKRVREMRERGEEPSPEIRAKLRELFQSGALQRPGGGGGPGGPGGFGGGGGGGGGQRQRPAQPTWRTVYLATTNGVSGNEPVIRPQPTRIKTGITDGAFTEITDGLNEGDTVLSGIKQPVGATPAAPTGTSPFGGGRRGF
jgi:HlyD family secretion protein